MDEYSANEVYEAAVFAYQHTPAGNNSEYVIGKSNLFVSRCLRAQDGYEPISRDTIADIAYAALDSEIESYLWSALRR